MTTPAGFGWVVDDGCPLKREAGGPSEFAIALIDGKYADRGGCDAGPTITCELLDEPMSCVGIVAAPMSEAAERWLIDRLPVSIESLPGQLLRQNLKESAVTGKRGAALREAGFMEAARPVSRQWGPFFRAYTVTSDQLLEELLCAGHVQPAHALACLLHVGGIAVDGEVLEAREDGPKLADIMKRPETRSDRTLCTIHRDDDDDPSIDQLKRYLRAMYAAFVQDTEVRVFGGPET